jgi:hypothetical protein
MLKNQTKIREKNFSILAGIILLLAEYKVQGASQLVSRYSHSFTSHRVLQKTYKSRETISFIILLFAENRVQGACQLASRYSHSFTSHRILRKIINLVRLSLFNSSSDDVFSVHCEIWY